MQISPLPSLLSPLFAITPLTHAHGVPDPLVLVSMIQWCAKNRPDLRDAEAEMDKRISAEERLFFRK